MAKTTRATAVKEATPPNTSAPASDTAEALVPGAEQSAPQSTLQPAPPDTTLSEHTSDAPLGDAGTDENAGQDLAPSRSPTALTVSAQVDGFRRAGRAWSTAPETVDVDDFTDDQIYALLSEPMLRVTVVCD